MFNLADQLRRFPEMSFFILRVDVFFLSLPAWPLSASYCWLPRTSSLTCVSSFCISLTLSHRLEPSVFSLDCSTATSLVKALCFISRLFLPLLRLDTSRDCLYLLTVLSSDGRDLVSCWPGVKTCSVMQASPSSWLLQLDSLWWISPAWHRWWWWRTEWRRQPPAGAPQHEHLAEGVVHHDVLNVLFHQVFLYGPRSQGGQTCPGRYSAARRGSADLIGTVHLDAPGPIREDEIFTVRESITCLSNTWSTSTHLQHILVSQIIEVLMAWEVVANDVMSLPSAKERGKRLHFHLHRVIQNKNLSGVNAANLIPVINILGRGRKDGLKRMDGGDATIYPSVIIITKKTPSAQPCVLQVHVFFHSNITPVWDLDDSGHAGDGQERAVVLRMYFKTILTIGRDVVRKGRIQEVMGWRMGLPNLILALTFGAELHMVCVLVG